MFKNIFNTVMNVKRKIKDKVKVRMDMSLFCHHKNMELVYDGSQIAKPKVNFTFDNNAQLLIY